MPHITRELLRRRSEHNEGMITTLEELTLHQEELEAINDVRSGGGNTVENLPRVTVLST